MPKVLRRRRPFDDYTALGAGSEADLGLKSPVTYGDTVIDQLLIRLRELFSGTDDPTARVAGLYAGRLPFMGHRISVNPQVVPEEMRETLEHELKHAQEQERGVPVYPESPGMGAAEDYARQRKTRRRDIRLK